MTKKNLFKSMVVIICLLLQFNLSAQVPPITLHVATAGTLPSLIAENRKYEITDLTLTGNLNGTDIRYIREMAGRSYEGTSSNMNGSATNGKLANLDLSGANIVSGGDYYLRVGSNSIYAFCDCTGLTSVTIGNSVTSIGGGAFVDCTGLTSVTIGNSVTSIGDYAFWGCTGLTSVTIGNSVTSIGDYAFYDCKGLTSVTIPESVTSIGDYAFYDCKGLTSITIGNSVTSIGDYAFGDCKGLTSVTIPESVTSIGGCAFKDCTGLTSVTIPESVTSIGGSAFEDCTGLTSITIGNRVTSIGQWTFGGCTRLTEIHSKNPIPPSLASESFSQVNKTTCILYVPKGSKSAYQSASQWKSFKNIIEEDEAAINILNKDSITLQPISNGIAIETKEQTPVTIYNLSGQKVYQNVVSGNIEIRLNKGVYILRVNNESEIVLIK